MGISNLLGNIYGTWGEIFDSTQYDFMGQIFNVVSIVLYVIMGLVGAGGAIYAIYLGIQLGRAEDQSKRDDAKKHLITVLIAVAVTVVLVLFFNNLLPMIVSAFVDIPKEINPNAGAFIHI